MDNLTMDVLAAGRAGMSYGNWKALHPKTKRDTDPVQVIVDKSQDYETPKLVKCIVCGKEFESSRAHRTLCSEECRNVRDIQHKYAYAEKYRERKRDGKKGKED